MVKKGSGNSKNAAARAAAAAAVAAAAEPSTAGKSPEEEEIRVNNLYDGGALRAAMDDCARQVLLDAGYDEDYSVSNVKIALGLSAIAIALYAQFGAGKFPGCYWTVFACVMLYIVLTATLQLYVYLFESDVFMMTIPTKDSPTISVSSQMDRYDPNYTLQLREGKPGLKASKKSVSKTVRVEQFFHADGYFAEEAFREVTWQLLDTLIDAPSKKDK